MIGKQNARGGQQNSDSHMDYTNAISILMTLKWNTHQDFVLTHPTFIRDKLQIQKTSHLASNYLEDVFYPGVTRK